MRDVKIHQFGHPAKNDYVLLYDYLRLKDEEMKLRQRYHLILDHAILGRAIEYAYKNGYSVEYEFGVFFVVIENNRKGTIGEWYTRQLKTMKLDEGIDV